jgi:hypothetical protein
VKQVEILNEAARLADDYSLTHKHSFVPKSTGQYTPPSRNSKGIMVMARMVIQTSQRDSKSQTHCSTNTNNLGHDTKSMSQLVEAQLIDLEVANLFQRVLPENELSENPVAYYENYGVLVRKWRPLDAQVY